MRIEQDAPLFADQAPALKDTVSCCSSIPDGVLLMEEKCESMDRRNEWFDWLQND